jgi:thiol-disulfide isomerase/thioredoxin
MSRGVRWLVILVVVALVAGGGYWAYSSGGSHEAGVLPTPAPGSPKIDEDTPLLRTLKAHAGIETCTPGTAQSQLPHVTLACLGGGPSVDLASLKGPMLLSFWYAGCGPCKKEMPALEAFDKAHGNQVPVIGVDLLDLYPASAIAMMHRHGATYPSLADPGGDLQDTETFAKVSGGLPRLYFVDAQGRVTYEHAGGVDSEAELADLVRQHLGVDL